MKLIDVSLVVVLLSAFFVTSTGKTGFQFKLDPSPGFTQTVTFKNAYPRFIGNIGGVSALFFTVNYSAPVDQIIKQVGAAIVPLVEWGLAMVPGGNIFGGIIKGIWGLMAPLFGGPEKNPMEHMIESMKEELDAMKKSLKEIAEKIPEHMTKELEIKLGNIITTGAQGEIDRNEYVCSKYALSSERFSEEVENNNTLNETLRYEMIALMHDCDNFLKDTASVFVYDEFSDVLWVPAVITTLIRTGFLAEACNYGVYLNIEDEMIIKWWSELKLDLKGLFRFADSGMKKRLETIVDNNGKNINFTSIEYDGCRLQAQLLFTDRDVYMYGVPKFFQISNNNTELRIANFNTTGPNEPLHIQIYYNGIGSPPDSSDVTMLNCISGRSTIHVVPTGQMSFRVIYVPNKSYQIRVLYFVKKYKYLAPLSDVNKEKTVKKEIMEADSIQRNLTVHYESGNTIRININSTSRKPRKSGKSFLIKTGFHEMHCINYIGADPPWFQLRAFVPIKVTEKCYSNKNGYSGIYTIETVFGFTISTDELNTKGKIVIEAKKSGRTLIMGVELIMLPIFD